MKKIGLMLCAATVLFSGCAGQRLHEGQQAFEQQNYSAAMDDLLPQAANGNAKAQYAVGYMYYYGKGIAQDKAVGKNWIDKAASQGLPQAIKAQTAIQRQAELNPLHK